MSKPILINYTDRHDHSPEELEENATKYFSKIQTRRTIRQFSDKPVPKKVIEHCIKAAGSAPSGANLQPWHFTAVSDPELKSKIRMGAEKEEREFYESRAPKEWLKALEPFGTDSHKPFLESAPWLIAIFMKKYGISPEGKQFKHYYASESVGIATGLLISAIHHTGLVSLTHTPSPMNFLNSILERPSNEKPYLLLVVGYPDNNAKVPDIKRKSLSEISNFV